MGQREDDVRCMELVLSLLPAASCSYDEWLKVGMAAQRCGLPCASWDAWSAADGERYRQGECARKWGGFGERTSEVTVATAIDICKAHGCWRTESSVPDAPMGWDDAVPDYQVLRPEYVAPASIREPSGRDWEPAAEMTRYLEALFRRDEHASFCMWANSFTKKDGSLKYVPSEGVTRQVGEVIDGLRAHPDDIGSILNDSNPGGAWIRINPVAPHGKADVDVTAWRHTLIESDSMDPAEQLALVRRLKLPCAAIVHSGNKSIHAIVRVDAEDERQYQERVDYVVKVCGDNGLKLDRQNRNPSRYTRLPGVMRGDRKQYLIDVDCGLSSFEEWQAYIEESTDDLPDIEAADDFIASPPPLAEPIIDGVLRRRHKMLVSGPSKAGKSYLLMELALAVAAGRDWLGWSCHQGRALYINLELDAASCKHRFADLCKALDYRPMKGALDVWNLRGKSAPLSEIAPKLIRRCRDRSYAVIIIDPIYKVITGDENTAADMSRFCNFFDFIADRTGAAIVVCHHHSKGDQGQKKSMDRASGSGVFARDPDALLDVIELSVGERKAEQIARRLACLRIGEMLDMASPVWRKAVVSDSDLDSVLEAADEHLPKELVDEAMRCSLADVRDATAWRVDGVLREFPAFAPRNIWFRWPLHLLDETGMLADALADGQQPTYEQQERIREDIRQSRRETASNDLLLAYDTLAAKGCVTVGELAENMNVSAKTIRRRIERMDNFKTEKGVVMKCK